MDIYSLVGGNGSRLEVFAFAEDNLWLLLWLNGVFFTISGNGR